MTTFIKKNLTNILLLTILVILALVLFKDKIRLYLKAQEVLKRVNYYRIPDVAFKCYKGIITTDDDYIPSKECSNTIDSYREKILRWDKLIKEYRDIECKDFKDKKEANDFYNYVSGELIGAFYVYRKKDAGVGPDDGKENLEFGLTTSFDGRCRYDPYGLDTNGDCNACENY